MIGETFGNYRLVRRLGSGAMGTVFLGEHERIARCAAVKVLSPEFAENAEILRRFFDEARATSLIHHPAIVDVIDCGVHPDGRRPYIVMEYLSGETLAAYLERSGTLSWQEACAIARQLAEGLGAAHRHRIVHRDVKPANVMRIPGPEGATGVASPALKVLDFGVAKLLHDTLSGVRTHPGKLLGTPEYMAPEQCSGEGTIDERTDVYGLGCVLYEMVCGHLPFVAKTLSELVVAHRWRQPPVPSSFVPLPAALDRLISRMLSKQPADRPPNMTSVAEALADALGETADLPVTPLAAREVATIAGFERSSSESRRPGPSARVLAIAGGFGVMTAFGITLQLTGPGWGAGDRKPPPRPPVASTPAVLPQGSPPPRRRPQPPEPAPQTPVAAAAAPPTPPLSGAGEHASLSPAPRLSPGPAERPVLPRRASPTPHRARPGRKQEIDADGIVDL
jgi:serine/threonine-protein kinase